MTDTPQNACDGGETRTVRTGSGDFEQCAVCGNAIRFDLVAHPFLGFQVCPQRTAEFPQAMIPRV